MTKLTMVIPGILMGLFLAPVVEASTQSAREVVCYERQDKSIIRVLMKMTASGRISSLEVVTPEYIWAAPGQPETHRFAAGESDTSPNLIEKMRSNEATVEALRDADRELVRVTFSVIPPEEAGKPALLDVEGLHGSIAMLGSYMMGKAPAALYYTASDGNSAIVGLECSKH